MPKPRVDFRCRECGFQTTRPLGRCPECDSWASFEEVALSAQPTATRVNGRAAPSGAPRPLRLGEIEAADTGRIRISMEEFARVMGGGIVRGSLTLVGGDPGVGKSTLLAQVADAVALNESGDVLYISGEESLAQVAMRARRLCLEAPNLLFLSETDADLVLATVQERQCSVVIIDSIQSVNVGEVDALAGSVRQLRECALRFQQLAKSTSTAVFLVGHVTKDGAIAGPKVLEHMVDTVLYLEGERLNQYRLLRSTKNRFGPTHEVGVFEMQTHGMTEVSNPSALFLTERPEGVAGSVVTVAMEGTRPILQEIQALVSRSSLAMPRRAATGFDGNRLNLLTAVLSRRVGIPLYDQDVYLNVVGGLRVEEPSADLAAALAIVSSVRDRDLPADLVAVGEIGLSGEVRGVAQLEQRLREAAKLGFTTALVPRQSAAPGFDGITTISIATLRDAVRHLGL